MKINQILQELTDLQAQSGTATAPADPVPSQGFAVRLTALPRASMAANITWAALMSVLPKEFPTMDNVSGSPAHELVARLVKTKQPQVVKSGLSRDLAETIADKIANWPTGATIPTDIVKQ